MHRKTNLKPLSQLRQAILPKPSMEFEKEILLQF